MPTYNHGEFIGESVESVLAQTYTNWELIIVNNFSTDNTDQVLSTYIDSRIHIEKFSNGGVIAKSRNKGLTLAKGKYIAFLDSDDIWEIGKLSIQVAVMNKRDDLLLCSTALIYFPNKKRSPLVNRLDKIISLNRLKKANIISNSSVLIKYSCIKEIGFLDESPELMTIEDYDFWLRILKYRNRSIYFIGKPLLKYRLSNMNVSGVGRKINIEKEFLKYKSLGEKLFSGKELKKFLRYKRSQIIRQSLEIEYSIGSKYLYNKDLLFEDKLRMLLSVSFRNYNQG